MFYFILQDYIFFITRLYFILGLNFKTVFYNTLQHYILLCYQTREEGVGPILQDYIFKIYFMYRCIHLQ